MDASAAASAAAPATATVAGSGGFRAASVREVIGVPAAAALPRMLRGGRRQRETVCSSRLW